MRLFLYLFLLLTACSANKNFKSLGEEYLGVQYVSDPLGEETFPDTDPLIRRDAFDCVTFVETVLAGEDVNTLNKIRYKDGEISFINRNHFIESDWLKNNCDIVENISSNYANTKIRTVVIDKKNWLKKKHNIDSDFKPEIVEIEYIPYDDLIGLKITEPLIVLFITGNSGKSDKLGTDLAVVHMGFVFSDGTLRHASSKAGKVVDVNFFDYAKEREKNKNNLGITLVKIK